MVENFSITCIKNEIRVLQSIYAEGNPVWINLGLSNG